MPFLMSKKALFNFKATDTRRDNIAMRQATTRLCGRFIKNFAAEEILNLQPKDGKGKPYQVKQVREVILKYHIRIGE